MSTDTPIQPSIDLTALAQDITILNSGQPVESPERLQTKVVTVRMTEAQHAAIKKASYKSERSMNVFCLSAALTAAMKILIKEVQTLSSTEDVP